MQNDRLSMQNDRLSMQNNALRMQYGNPDRSFCTGMQNGTMIKNKWIRCGPRRSTSQVTVERAAPSKLTHYPNGHWLLPSEHVSY